MATFSENSNFVKILKCFKEEENDYSDPETAIAILYNTMSNYSNFDVFIKLWRDCGETRRYYILYWPNYEMFGGDFNHTLYFTKFKADNDIADDCFSTDSIKQAYLFDTPYEIEGFVNSTDFDELWSDELEAYSRSYKILIVDKNYNIIEKYPYLASSLFEVWEIED